MRVLHTSVGGAECAARELGALLVMTRKRRGSCSPAVRYLKPRRVDLWQPAVHDLRTGDAALKAMDRPPEAAGDISSIEFYEVAADRRADE